MAIHKTNDGGAARTLDAELCDNASQDPVAAQVRPVCAESMRTTYFPKGARSPQAHHLSPKPCNNNKKSLKSTVERKSVIEMLSAHKRRSLQSSSVKMMQSTAAATTAAIDTKRLT